MSFIMGGLFVSGLTIARLYIVPGVHLPAGSAVVAVELAVSAVNAEYKNVSMQLWVNTSTDVTNFENATSATVVGIYQAATITPLSCDHHVQVDEQCLRTVYPE